MGDFQNAVEGMSWRASCNRVSQFRIFLDTTNKQSAGLKSFVEKNYPELKVLNPTTPFLIRMRDGASSQVWARYADGAEESTNLDGASEEQCEAAFKALVAKAVEPTNVQPDVEYVVAAGQEGLEMEPWMNEFSDDAEVLN